jgi:hypothetical protein
MRTDRWLIAALMFLVGGLWLTFEWGHGSAGLNVAFPAEGTKLAIDITTTGWPVMTGLPLVIIGVMLMAAAFVTAVIAQFHRPDEAAADSITRLRIPTE